MFSCTKHALYESFFIPLVVFSGEQAFMPEALDPSTEPQYTGQFYQPAMSPGAVGSTGTDSPEEEPPLLEGKQKRLYLFPHDLYA